ncbi:MAG: amino acid racemase [Nanoarchaeota archaeon]|nr:amino acid racemase [Nanoarchaeota archaeon]
MGKQHSEVLVVFISGSSGSRFKTIGILGGMGPESTAELYLRIIKLFQKKFGAKYDDDYPEMIIYNLPIPDVVEDPTRMQDIRDMLVEDAKKLEALGVDIIGVACNTVDFFMPVMREAVSIPILSIIDEIREKVKRKEKVGILATEMAIKEGLFDSLGPELILPTEAQRKLLTRIIMNILSGRRYSDDASQINTMVKSMQDDGADLVVLGCTDLPLIYRRRKGVIDTIDILAEALVRESSRPGSKRGGD